MGIQLPLKRAQHPHVLAHVYCDQTAELIKMPVGTEVDLGPGHIVLDGDSALPPVKGSAAPSPVFGPCLLFPNGCRSQLLEMTCSQSVPWRVCVGVQNYLLAESMSAESMAEFYDAAEQFESSSDESDEVRI